MKLIIAVALVAALAVAGLTLLNSRPSIAPVSPSTRGPLPIPSGGLKVTLENDNHYTDDGSPTPSGT